MDRPRGTWYWQQSSTSTARRRIGDELRSTFTCPLAVARAAEMEAWLMQNRSYEEFIAEPAAW